MSSRSSGRSSPGALVGRSAELETFQAALDRVEEGRSCVIQVTGETGIGRTRLLNEFVTLAEAHNALGVLTRPGTKDNEPLGPLRRAELTASLPALAQAVAAAEPDEDHFSRLLRALSTETGRAPVWLLIDDVHLADEATRSLMELMVAAMRHGSLRDARLGLVLSRLRAPAEPSSDTPSGGDNLPDSRWHMTLRRLTRSEVRETLESRFGVAPEAELLELLMESSGGNPLLVSELLVFLERKGYLQQVRDHLVVRAAPGELALPRDLTSLLQGKVGAISAPCRRAMTLAAFLGNEFDSLALAQLLGQDGRDLDSVLEEAAGASLVERREAGMVSFKHPAARDLFYGRSDPRNREETHLHICQRLIGEFGERADDHALTITHHLLRAGRQAEPALVLRYAARAGETAFKHHSYYLAGRYFEAAARAGGEAMPAGQRADLYTRAGVAFQRWSDGTRSSACFEEAVRLYESCDDLSGYARALHGLLRNYIAFGEGDAEASEVAARLQGLLAALPDQDLELRVRVHDTLAAHYHNMARYDVAEAYAQTAMTVAQNSADPTLRCIPVTSLALAQMEQLRLTEARTTWLQGLSYDRAAGATRYEGLHLQRLPVPLFCLGEIREAGRYNQASYHHNEAIGNTGELGLNLTVDVMIANLRGDFDKAIDVGWSAMELMVTTRYLWSAPSLIGALSYALAMRERFDEAESLVSHLSTNGLTFADTGPYRSTARRLTELLEVYRSGSLGNPVGSGEPAEPKRNLRGVRVGSLGRLCTEAELALLQNRPVRLTGIHDALEFVHRRGLALPLGWCCSIPRSLALSTALRSGPPRALRYFEQAEKLAERAGAPLEVGRVAFYRGLANLICGGAIGAAQADLDTALDCFRRLDATVLARLAVNALSRAEQASTPTEENHDA